MAESKNKADFLKGMSPAEKSWKKVRKTEARERKVLPANIKGGVGKLVAFKFGLKEIKSGKGKKKVPALDFVGRAMQPDEIDNTPMYKTWYFDPRPLTKEGKPRMKYDFDAKGFSDEPYTQSDALAECIAEVKAIFGDETRAALEECEDLSDMYDLLTEAAKEDVYFRFNTRPNKKNPEYTDLTLSAPFEADVADSDEPQDDDGESGDDADGDSDDDADADDESDGGGEDDAGDDDADADDSDGNEGDDAYVPEKNHKVTYEGKDYGVGAVNAAKQTVDLFNIKTKKIVHKGIAWSDIEPVAA